ncbi:MAG: 16S rRNA (guanine(966)-N(2))-methyltransferase RsmD [Paracoccaceae bacterium]
MRIVAGKFRGQTLAAVGKGDAAAHLRPTTDRVRENIFNMLQGGKYGNQITNARVLDLFAGTGALGLEALSRGASHVSFVDDGNSALALLRQNITLCNARDDTKTIRSNATQLTENPNPPFDLIFLDPPYGKGLATLALQSALAGNWIARDALIVLEEGTPIPPPPEFRLLDQRKYGSTYIMFMEPEAPND